MTVIVFYVKPTCAWLYMHSPTTRVGLFSFQVYIIILSLKKTRQDKTIVLKYYYTGTSINVFQIIHNYNTEY